LLTFLFSECSKEFKRILAKQGMKFKLGTKVTGAKVDPSSITLITEPRDGGKTEEVLCDVVLCSVGRRPYLDGLGLDVRSTSLAYAHSVIL
jgi:dihydrolipoamide dehydrogenase